MKNVKLLLLMSLFFITGIGFSQNYVTYSPQTKTIDLNSGVEGTVDVLVNCYGSTSDPVFLNALQSCANNDGIFSTSYTNGSILTPGQNTTIRYKFKKTVTADTQIAYKFSTDGSCFQDESKMIKITVNYKSISTGPIGNNYISGNQTIYTGQPASTITGSTPSGGNGTYIYSWQQKTGNGTWTAVSGANGINYSPGIPSVTTSYRRFVSSAGSTVTGTSNEITVTVIPPSPVLNNTIYLDGLAVIGSQPTGGLGNGSYQNLWYIIDEDGDNYQFPDTSSSLMLNTPQFSGYLNSPHNFTLIRIVTSGNQTSRSNDLQMPHVYSIQNNIISINNNIVTGSTPTGGLGNYTYSWAIYYTGDAIDFDETTKDLDLTSHLSQINTILQIDPLAKLVRIATSGVSSTSNRLSLSSVTAKAATLNKESTVTIAVYPNPTSDSVNFTTNSSSDKEIEIIIYSEGLGNPQSVFKGTATPNQIVKWNIPSNYSKGIYYYKIISDNKELKSGKIIYQ